MHANVWTCIIGFHVLWTSTGRLSTVLLECIYFAVSICLPLPLVLSMAIEKAISQMPISGTGERECWYVYTSPSIVLGYPSMKIGFFVLDVLTLSCIMYKVWKTRTWSSQMKKTTVMTLFFIQVCFFINTLAGIVIIGNNLHPIILQAATIIQQFQGFLNSVVVGRKFVLKQMTKFIKYLNAKIRHREFKSQSDLGGSAVMLEDTKLASDSVPRRASDVGVEP